jgi:hypothetical protein
VGSKVKHIFFIHQGFKRNDVNVNVYIKHLKDDFIILVEFEMVAHAMNNQLHLIFEMKKLLNSFWNVTSRGLHYSYLDSKCCETRGVCHTMPLPFTLKTILRQKKNYGNSNISPCKNILKKNPPQETKILQNIITL